MYVYGYKYEGAHVCVYDYVYESARVCEGLSV